MVTNALELQLRQQQQQQPQLQIMDAGNDGSNAVAGSSMQADEPCFPLWSLPELPFMTVVKCLEKEDVRRLVRVCRGLAAAVSALSSATQIKVTPFTGWEGLCKVLATRAIVCKSLCVEKKPPPRTPEPVSWWSWLAQQRTALNNLGRNNAGNCAVSFLLRPGALELSFQGITKLCINAYPLPCVLPPRLASLLPQLEELDITCEADRYTHDADLQPIPYCSTLRKIRCSATYPSLPSKYHTSEELRKQLPNVVSLEIRLLCSSKTGNIKEVGSFVRTMVNAWSDQLTHVMLHTDKAPVQLQHCTQLQSLDWSVNLIIQFARCLPQSLTILRVGSITEQHFQTILHLPLLRTFTLFSFVGDLQHDWSKHSCTWQQLTVSMLPMVYLSKLPLHSLKGQGCLNIEYLDLPAQLHEDTISKVQHAAQCVSNAGILIGSFRGWKMNHSMSEHNDRSLAAVVRAVCRVICPSKTYQFTYGMTRYNQATSEMIMWLSPTLEYLQLPCIPKTLPWFWQELCCCNNLTKVRFFSNSYHENGADITSLVKHASEHYVIPTCRALTLAIGVCARVHNTLREEIRMRVFLLQQNDLPNSVMIQSYAWKSHDCLEITLKLRRTEDASAQGVSLVWQQLTENTLTPQQWLDKNVPPTLPALVFQGTSIHPISIIRAWSAICSLLRFLKCTHSAVRQLWLTKQRWEEEGDEKMNYFALNYAQLADAVQYADWEQVKQILQDKFQLPV